MQTIIDENGKIILDRLLASLTVENGTIKQQNRRKSSPQRMNGGERSPSINFANSKNCENIFKYPTIVRDQNHNEAADLLQSTDPIENTTTPTNGVHVNLNDVIANLTDFSRIELIRQQSISFGSSSGDNSHHHSPNVARYSSEPVTVVGPATTGFRRLASESEKRSSISPSLSERSNGIVSWSDQVTHIVIQI